MEAVRDLEKRKNRIIRNFLKEVVGDKDEVEFTPLIKDKKLANEIRTLFLDSINELYKDAIIYIAGQKGVIVQSLKVLAEHDLPKNFSLEDTIDRVEKKMIERKIQSRRADGKED